MKTPEEIKKGLAVHDSDDADCIECPYEHVDTQEEWEHCVINMEHDALAYIQKLEADLEIQEIKRNAMFAKAEQLERERDFLLKYLTESNFLSCDICKHEPEDGGALNCDRVRKIKGACFEWRGLPEV